MNRFILYIFGIFLIAQTGALSCNFKIADFGTPKENVKLDESLIAPMLMPDRFGGENLIIPLEQICKSNEKLYGTQLIYLYIENTQRGSKTLRFKTSQDDDTSICVR